MVSGLYPLPRNSLFSLKPQREHGKLDATQIKALREFLPNSEERKGIVAYMAKAGESEEAKASAYAELSECEKYMFTMMDVTNAASKFDCMLFRAQFRSRFEELVKSIQVVEKACQELRPSERLRDIFGIILTLVNEINTGGDGNGAAGFTLDTLLKLNEVSLGQLICLTASVATHSLLPPS